MAIRVKFICSQDQLVDVLTKHLSVARSQNLRTKFTIISSTFCLRGLLTVLYQQQIYSRMLHRILHSTVHSYLMFK
jgi:hypothetical protein